MRVLVQPFINETLPFSPGLDWPKSLSPPRRGKKKVPFLEGGPEVLTFLTHSFQPLCKGDNVQSLTPVSNRRRKKVFSQLVVQRALTIYLLIYLFISFYYFFVVCLLGQTCYLLMAVDADVTKMMEIKEIREQINNK